MDRTKRLRRRGLRLLHWAARLINRCVTVGITSEDPDIRRRQAFANIGALMGVATSYQHVIEQALRDYAALAPLVWHNAIFGLLFMVTPLFHRRFETLGALWLCFTIIIGTAHVISLTGLDGGAQVYFAFTAGAFLFFGVRHWRLFALVVLGAFACVILALVYAPMAGPMARVAPGYMAWLSASVIVNVMVINIWLFTYALIKTHRAETRLAAAVGRADRLLLAILPRPIATRLKRRPNALIANRHEAVTIFFADIVGFTEAARTAAPEVLVAWLDGLFKGIDALAEEHKVQKIKTIGDAYMAASGMRLSPDVGAARIAGFALDFRDFVHRYGGLDGGAVDVRVGIHTGPVVAGVIGGTRFSYDLWGDTVNTASR
ncbi:MAG: adenylate/guanylate cyclase domain-containing protein, partial [Pseudomonadota bacterium]